MSEITAVTDTGACTYLNAIEFLLSLGWELKSAKFGLEGIRALVEDLGHPQRAFPSIQVAGTNGKGSVCAMVESGLREAGYRTGLYTSPHLIEPLERIALNGKPSSKADFALAFQAAHATNERLLERGAIEHHTTFFETVTAMGFWLFQHWRVDWGVLEVGLGGRLDATSVARPEVAVITRVDLDHQKILGNTLAVIAMEKAGILKQGVPVVIGPQYPEAEAVIRARAEEMGAPVVDTSPWAILRSQVELGGSYVELDGPQRLNLRIPLAGEHQIENAVTAVAVLDHLGLRSSVIERGIASARWPGRIEVLRRDPMVLVDGAHNASGAAALARYLNRVAGSTSVTLVFGCTADKDAGELLAHLMPLADRVIFTRANNPRSADPRDLAASFADTRCTVRESLEDALPDILAARLKELVVITGSLFLVGEARALLLKAETAPGAAA